MSDKLTILGICGSLRQSSFNAAALRVAQSLVPANVTLNIYQGLETIPPFNQDQENQLPSSVVELKKQISAADAILFVTPEYNYSVPGVLKNAIDWASRPYGASAWEGKPAAIMGASIGMVGTARAQYHLRQTMVFLNMFPLNRPEVMIPLAADKFDASGNLTDDKTRDKIGELMVALVAWAQRLEKK